MSLLTLKSWLVRACTGLEGRKWLLLGWPGYIGPHWRPVLALFPLNLSLFPFTEHREPLGDPFHVNVLLLLSLQMSHRSRSEG